MKKIIGFAITLVGIVLSGCFDMVEESTIDSNGGGTYISTTDMSKMIGLAKMMGGGEDMKELEEIKVDTVVNLNTLKDSLQNLDESEKQILENGTLKIVMDMVGEKFYLSFTFPYSSPSDMETIASILKKTKKDIVSKQMNKLIKGGDAADEENKDDSENAGIEEYYKSTYTKGKLTRKVIQEKYENVTNDQGLKSMQEMAQMGMSATIKTIINLPSPAKKADGRGLKLSDDKKKVTIEGTIDDFFENPAQFEYEIEY